MPQRQHLSESGDLSEYDRDLVAWATENAALLRAGKLDRIDAAHIAEELEDLGKSERRALGNHLRNLVMHLLEWEFQPERRTGSWRSSVDNALAEIAEILEDSPSLRPTAAERLEKGYPLARKNAVSETGLEPGAFPQQCPLQSRTGPVRQLPAWAAGLIGLQSERRRTLQKITSAW